MQIILDFRDWLEGKDEKTIAAIDIREFSDWLIKKDQDIIADFREDTVKKYLEYQLVKEGQAKVIKVIGSFILFLEFLRSICILEMMDFKPEWLNKAIKTEING